MAENTVVAHNKCMRCEHEWDDFPGVFATIKSCPKCDSIYWTWMNYYDLFDKYGKRVNNG